MAWNPQVHPSSEGSLSVESILDETPHGSAAVPWTDDDASDWRMRCDHWFSKESSS